MKVTIFLYFALFFFGVCHAQLSFKINEGCSYNHLITDISNREFTTNENEIGYSAGFQLKYDITKFIGLEIGICWIPKNYSFRRTENYSGIFDKYTNNYLQIPLTLPIRIIEKKKYRIFFNAGIFGSYLIFARVNGVIPNVFNTINQQDEDEQSVQNFNLTEYFSKYTFDKQKDNRFEFGLQMGISLEYKINAKTGFFLDYRLYQSLTDLQKKYMVNQIAKINQTTLVSVGFLVELNKRNR